MELALGIILLVAALFLIVAVLLQSSQSKGLSGTVAGSAETFYGKTKGKTVDKMLAKLTTIVGVVFVVVVLLVYVIQDTPDYKGNDAFNNAQQAYEASQTTGAEEETKAETTAETTAEGETGAAETGAEGETGAADTSAETNG